MTKKLMMAVAAVAVAFGAWAAEPTVTNVRGMQREKSNLVDIYYDIEATDGGTYSVRVEIEGRTNEVTAATFTGDVGDGIAPGRNRHILWNAGADWPGNKGDVRVIVTATKQDDKHKGVQLWEGVRTGPTGTSARRVPRMRVSIFGGAIRRGIGRRERRSGLTFIITTPPFTPTGRAMRNCKVQAG